MSWLNDKLILLCRKFGYHGHIVWSKDDIIERSVPLRIAGKDGRVGVIHDYFVLPVIKYKCCFCGEIWHSAQETPQCLTSSEKAVRDVIE